MGWSELREIPNEYSDEVQRIDEQLLNWLQLERK